MKLFKLISAIALSASLCTGVAVTPSHAAGLWQDWVQIGGPAFCGSTVTGVVLPSTQNPYGVVPGSTQGTGIGICQHTIPAGPTLFVGGEYLPVDIGAIGSTSTGPVTSAVVTLLQVGQGPFFDNTTAGASLTIPNSTSWFVLDTGTSATVAVTFPAVAVEGQIQHITCGIGLTALTVVANTGQAVKNQPVAACTAGQGFAYRFVAVAQGTLAANTWVRVY
jgi:hypothetical protein